MKYLNYGIVGTRRTSPRETIKRAACALVAYALVIGVTVYAFKVATDPAPNHALYSAECSKPINGDGPATCGPFKPVR